MSFATAPSAPPTSLTVYTITTFNITIHWGPVDCIQRNGDITGYSVRYRVDGNNPTQLQTVNVGPATSEFTISELIEFSTYSIEVAAVNAANIGVYSDPVSVKTKCNLFEIITIHSFIPTVTQL